MYVHLYVFMHVFVYTYKCMQDDRESCKNNGEQTMAHKKQLGICDFQKL